MIACTYVQMQEWKAEAEDINKRGLLFGFGKKLAYNLLMWSIFQDLLKQTVEMQNY